jgi:hypothetical protein
MTAPCWKYRCEPRTGLKPAPTIEIEIEIEIERWVAGPA